MDGYGKLTDNELAALLKGGDHAAFTEIYDRHAVPIFYRVNQMLRDEELSRDLVQDLFVGLWDRPELLKVDGNLAGYLYIIARNSVLRHIQKSKLKSSYLSSLARHMGEIGPDPMEAINEKELGAKIQKEIEQLPPKMRIIFEMSRNQDLSHAQIAEKLGLSDKTVKKQVNNALKTLRSRLGLFAPAAVILLELAKRR